MGLNLIIFSSEARWGWQYNDSCCSRVSLWSRQFNWDHFSRSNEKQITHFWLDDEWTKLINLLLRRGWDIFVVRNRKTILRGVKDSLNSFYHFASFHFVFLAQDLNIA